jgi:hypothetical protein
MKFYQNFLYMIKRTFKFLAALYCLWLLLEKNYSGCRMKFMFRLFFALIGQFYPVYNYIHGRLSESFSGSQAAFGTTFRFTGGFWKPGTHFLWRVTGKIFTRTKWFHKSKQKFHFGFSSQKDNQNLWKPSALFQKVLFWFFGPSKQLSFRVAIPLSAVHYGNDLVIQRFLWGPVRVFKLRGIARFVEIPGFISKFFFNIQKCHSKNPHVFPR